MLCAAMLWCMSGDGCWTPAVGEDGPEEIELGPTGTGAAVGVACVRLGEVGGEAGEVDRIRLAACASLSAMSACSGDSFGWSGSATGAAGGEVAGERGEWPSLGEVGADGRSEIDRRLGVP